MSPNTSMRNVIAACASIGSGLALAANDGFSVRELNQIRAEVARNMGKIIEAWNDHCRER